jgi:hypothetical protein
MTSFPSRRAEGGKQRFGIIIDTHSYLGRLLNIGLLYGKEYGQVLYHLIFLAGGSGVPGLLAPVVECVFTDRHALVQSDSLER